MVATNKADIGTSPDERSGRPVAAAIASFTDNTTGTASDTLIDLNGTFDDAEVENALASIAAKINAILAAMRANGSIST